MKTGFTILFVAFVATGYAQNFPLGTVTVGSAYQMNLQQLGVHGDGYLFHGAKSDGTGYSSVPTHPSFGARGMMFRYFSGIHFYAASQSVTQNAALSPALTTRFFIGNNGNVGIGTEGPRGKFDVDGVGDIYLADETVAGSNQGIYLPGSISISPYVDSNNNNTTAYLMARRSNGAGSLALRIRTSNNGAVTEAMHIAADGKVGLGVTSPLETLHLNGSIRGNQNGALRISTGNGTTDIGAMDNTASKFVTDRPVFSFNKPVTIAGNLDAIGTMTTTGLFINLNGTAAPAGYKLAVGGKILTEEVNVKAKSLWPDYVFDNNYALPSLDSVKHFIRVHHHLPEVLSAEEVKKNDGHALGEMDAVLLKKIEELTLYLIALKEENELLKLRMKKIEEAEKH